MKKDPLLALQALPYWRRKIVAAKVAAKAEEEAAKADAKIAAVVVAKAAAKRIKEAREAERLVLRAAAAAEMEQLKKEAKRKPMFSGQGGLLKPASKAKGRKGARANIAEELGEMAEEATGNMA